MATTYTVTFDLAEAQTGVSGHYPVLVRNSTYCPDNTIYAKTGDTVKFVVSEPSPDGASVSYNNTNIADTDPDPDEFTDDGTTNQNSPSSWEYTLTSANDDEEFYWFWFGTTVHSSGSGKKYSQRIRVNRVVGSPLMNGSTSAITVDQGDTITFSVSGLGGLLAASGNNDNRLYFAIFNQASGGSLINPTSYTGGGWDSSSNQLGKVKTTDTSTVLTVGSNMPTGTYYVYLTHFNAADSPGGNDFYGSEQRLSATALQFTVEEPTGTVSGLSLGDNVTTTSLNFDVVRNSGTITCDPTTFQPSVSVSNGSFKRKNGSGVAQDASWQTSSATIENGWSVDFKMTGPSGYSDSETGTLTIAEDSASLVVTTSADPGGGSGGSGGGGTSGTYGLRILDASGKVLFGDGRKMGNLIGSATISTPLANNTFSNYYEMVGVPHADGISERTGITIIDTYSGTNTTSPLWVIERHSSGLNGHFAWRVKHITAAGVSRPYNYIVFRY
tara:strand:+ start:3027 stop:4523 length:1497 start_codon:yes stop_codon:yes gene_type:complete